MSSPPHRNARSPSPLDWDATFSNTAFMPAHLHSNAPSPSPVGAEDWDSTYSNTAFMPAHLHSNPPSPSPVGAEDWEATLSNTAFMPSHLHSNAPSPSPVGAEDQNQPCSTGLGADDPFSDSTLEPWDPDVRAQPLYGPIPDFHSRYNRNEYSATPTPAPRMPVYSWSDTPAIVSPVGGWSDTPAIVSPVGGWPPQDFLSINAETGEALMYVAPAEVMAAAHGPLVPRLDSDDSRSSSTSQVEDPDDGSSSSPSQVEVPDEDSSSDSPCRPQPSRALCVALGIEPTTSDEAASPAAAGSLNLHLLRPRRRQLQYLRRPRHTWGCRHESRRREIRRRGCPLCRQREQ